MKVLVYLGTSRQGNMSQHVAKLVMDVATQHPEIEPELITSQQFPLSNQDEGTSAADPALTEKVVAADGFILVTPEYNHGYPGTLKYLLDMHLKEYIHKPVAFVGVSSGQIGGARAIEALVGAVREMGLVATFNDVNVGNVQDQLSDDGQFKDPEPWTRRINRLLEELVWMMKVLTHGRENVPSKHHQA